MEYIFLITKLSLILYSAMIIVRLRGGLGNQLFQFAAGAALADHHHVECKLDLYYYKKHPYRKYELSKFNIPVMLATRREIHRFTGQNAVKRFLNKYENYYHCPGVCVQPHYHFYEDFFRMPSDIYLSGYWQSEKYFSLIKPKLMEWYTSNQILDSKNKELAGRIASVNSVCVHVRRGDYNSYSIFGTIPSQYYKKAIEYVKQQVQNPEFFIFSDDINWCKHNLEIENANFVNDNTGADSYKDLLLMSHCKHNIIANSTFSWWGAWLNKNDSKIVTAPQIWFSKTYNDKPTPVYPARFYNTKDLIPQTWIRF